MKKQAILETVEINVRLDGRNHTLATDIWSIKTKPTPEKQIARAQELYSEYSNARDCAEPESLGEWNLALAIIASLLAILQEEGK